MSHFKNGVQYVLPLIFLEKFNEKRNESKIHLQIIQSKQKIANSLTKISCTHISLPTSTFCVWPSMTCNSLYPIFTISNFGNKRCQNTGIILLRGFCGLWFLKLRMRVIQGWLSLIFCVGELGEEFFFLIFDF